MTDRQSYPVQFTCEGFRLYGTVRLGKSRGIHPRRGVILLNQGPIDRSGAHQISLKIAQRLNGLGFPTLQFDARGVGESEGDWIGPPEGEPVQALYKRIFDGAWTADTSAAVDFFTAHTGVEDVLLMGLCGGASTALQAGAVHPSVTGMAMVGMPVRVLFDTSRVDDLVESFVRSETNGYFQKALTSVAWKRFLTLQTDYRTLGAVLARWARAVTRRDRAKPQLVSDHILRSFELAAKSRKRMLFVYGENDYLWAEFRELFLGSLEGASDGFRLATIPRANHTFTELEWQAQLYDILTRWTDEHGAAARPSR